MTELFVADEHSPLYYLWIDRGLRDISVCNVDFHCDLRGLLIDRRRQMARYVWQSDPFMNRLDSGSFLTHAVMNGIVTKLRWVHDEFGGRSYDDLYCVKYETDFTALPFRLTGGKKWTPLIFAEHTFANWGGLQPGEFLSIDWDGIAYADYYEKHIHCLMAEILDRELQADSVFVSRSPEYSNPDKTLFNEFIAGLEKKFKTKAVYLPSKELPLVYPSVSWKWKLYHLIEYRILRLMRKGGIF